MAASWFNYVVPLLEQLKINKSHAGVVMNHSINQRFIDPKRQITDRLSLFAILPIESSCAL